MDDQFGRTPAFPEPAVYDPEREQINSAGAYGFGYGLNVQQLVWLQIYSSVLSEPSVTNRAAVAFADDALPDALKRLKELA